MIMFFLTFFALYGGMHVYIYYRLRSTMQLTLTVPVLFILLTFAPLLVRLAEHYGLDTSAYAIALPGFVWMGFIFLLCVFLGISDSVYLLWRMVKHTSASKIISAKICKSALVVACLATGYSLFEVKTISTEQVTIQARQPHTLKKTLRVVQISDVHLGLMMNEKRLEGIINTINGAQPDILVSTGDLVDGRFSRKNSGHTMDKFALMLGSIPSPMGKYAVVGNHEYYAGIEQACELTKKSGFTVLINQRINHPSGITISGVDDQASERMGLKVPGSEQELVTTLPAGSLHILLKHRPLMQQDSDGKFDLQLSGHTHKGQLIPFYPLTWLKFPIHSGTSKTEKGTTIHVSRGTGTWGPPMRFLAPPEITIIDIVP